MLDQPWKLYLEADVFAAIAHISRYLLPLHAVDVCSEMVVKLYWERKDLPATIAVGVCGMARGWSYGEEMEDSAEVLGKVKAIAYNLASFTWPGWDEPGIEIGKSDLAIGLAAAKANLRLAGQLGKGALPHVRAYWLLGAQLLAAGEYDAAKAAFEKSAEFAGQDGAEGEVWLGRGFVALTEILAGDENAEVRLAEAKEQLAPLEHGPGFVEQVETARRVFERQAG